MSNEIQKRLEAAAERLGATRFAIYKWRSRGIPADWKIRLVETGEFTFQDLENVRPFRSDEAQEREALPMASIEVRT